MLKTDKKYHLCENKSNPCEVYHKGLIQFHFQNPTVNMKKSYCNHSNAKSCKKYVTIIGILKTILTPGLSKVAG